MMKKTHTRRGYTVVEIIMAMTLFAVGAAGVIAMQRVTIQGGADARRMDVGANIANEWLFRLQMDSMFWTRPNADFPSTSNISTDTQWLKLITTPGVWQSIPIPAANAAGLSPAADILGRDVIAGSGDHYFCTQIRLDWIADPTATFKVGALMRAEVRTFWARLEKGPVTDCASIVVTVPPDSAQGRNYYHFVYASTAVRTNPAQ